jgi:D-alanyl-D-alanine carboxypeptidase
VQVRRKVLGFVTASLLIAQCGPSQCAPAPPSTAGEAWAAFDRDLSSNLVGGGAGAVSVAVSKNGTVVHQAAYGKRLPWTSEPTETGDRFRIASISKVLTAVVVLQLVEQGRLGLDQPVGWALASAVGAGPVDGRIGDITVRRLLQHTAGLGVGDAVVFGATAGSCPDAARQVLSAPLTYAPGTRYIYANMGFCMLGLLIQMVTGRPYTDVVQDAELSPLGIFDMTLGPTYGTGPQDVWHYSGTGRNYMEVLWSAGAWLSTPTDLVRILDSLDPAKPGYHPLAAPAMCQGSGFNDKPDRWYGMGMICFTDGTWGHTGTLESAHAIVLHRPDGVTWSILTSGNYPRETDNLIGIMNGVLGSSGVMGFM